MVAARRLPGRRLSRSWLVGHRLACTTLLTLALLSTPALASNPELATPRPGEANRAALVTALAQARGPEQALALTAELEALRQQTVPPAVRLLLRRAQRETLAGQPRAATGDLNDGLDLAPDNPVLLRERAVARDAAGDTDGAVADLGAAISHDPDDVLSWQALARIEEDHASPLAAWKAWQHVIQLDPLLPGAAVRLDRLHRKAFGQPA